MRNSERQVCVARVLSRQAGLFSIPACTVLFTTTGQKFALPVNCEPRIGAA